MLEFKISLGYTTKSWVSTPYRSKGERKQSYNLLSVRPLESTLACPQLEVLSLEVQHNGKACVRPWVSAPEVKKKKKSLEVN